MIRGQIEVSEPDLFPLRDCILLAIKCLTGQGSRSSSIALQDDDSWAIKIHVIYDPPANKRGYGRGEEGMRLDS